MAKHDPFALRRTAAVNARTDALKQWQLQNPGIAGSETHRDAFLAGYEAAAGPIPATQEDFIAAQAIRFQAEAEDKQRRIASLPAGTCPECEGAGEFVGATHITKCDACNGTGRVA